ncbi:MAG: hypothetical protein Kow00124_06350 [Anaerolineae bacterium]
MSHTAGPPGQGDDPEEGRPLLPVEIELYIEPDGTVTFADLAAETIPIAHELNPDHPLACDVPEAAGGEEDGQDDPAAAI